MKNDNKLIDVSLDKAKYTCKACNYLWDGFIHVFSRAHLILQKDNKFIIIFDDIYYGFSNAKMPDLELIFNSRGWHLINSCPKCHSSKLTIINKNEPLRVKCQEIMRNDFSFFNNEWVISQKSIIDKEL